MCVTFAASSGLCQETERQIIYLEKDEKAPFAGDLFPPEESIRLALGLEKCKLQKDIEIEFLKTKHRLELGRAESISEAKAQGERERLELLEIEVSRANAWYRSPFFVATVTFVLTVGATVGVGLLVLAVEDN